MHGTLKTACLLQLRPLYFSETFKVISKTPCVVMDSDDNNDRSALASARAARARAEASMARTAAGEVESQAALSASRAARERMRRARESRTAARSDARERRTATMSDAEAAILSAQALRQWMTQNTREMRTAAAARLAALHANMPQRPPRIRIPRIRVPRDLPVNPPGNAVLNVISAVSLSLDDDSFSYASLHAEARRPRSRIIKPRPTRLPARLRNRDELDLRPFLSSIES